MQNSFRSTSCLRTSSEILIESPGRPCCDNYRDHKATISACHRQHTLPGKWHTFHRDHLLKTTNINISYAQQGQ